MRFGIFAILMALALTSLPASAQQQPAKQLFGAKRLPADLKARAIGSYARGCLAGGKMLPVNGEAWQAMRLSRNRNWGHPALVAYVEKLARAARAKDGWRGLLVGDMSQPRGGPMLTGHSSHQIGLDADIWLTEMPDRTLSRTEREAISATSMLKDKFSVDPAIWTDGHFRLIKRAASYPEVARIFVHPAIKKAMCEQAGSDRDFLRKVRPWWGHHYHFHVRLACPSGMGRCRNQAPPPPGDGCGAPLDYWYAQLRKPPEPPKPPKPPMTLDALPDACRMVLASRADMSVEPAVANPTPLKSADASAGISLPAAADRADLPWLREGAEQPAAPTVPLPARKPSR